MKEKVFTRTLDVIKKNMPKILGITLFGLLISTLIVPACGILPILAYPLSILVSVGMSMIFLRITREEEIYCVHLFDVFKNKTTAWRVILGIAWKSLWIFIWALIPIAGIYFAIRRRLEYMLTRYILLYEPEIPITEALNLSKERMMGYKKDVFLTYLFVILITCFIPVLFFGLAFIPGAAGIVFLVLFLITLIVVIILLTILFGVLDAEFYNEIEKNRLSTSIYAGNDLA